ncbi:hypothetical protein Sipo8835_00805 [Streptomyces ipomoeae]|uniref:Uncharacterized protein n=1 Tax=Streptomyces ipomoeae TaxID=103232 RepID=A0AAE8W7L2_9ACTN|nr:hypothetical protein [Streptomyces ipomoeae]TQE40035.1 hypothetical protein Sipo8835_00805 [Streptomyces ipomoeae]
MPYAEPPDRRLRAHATRRPVDRRINRPAIGGVGAALAEQCGQRYDEGVPGADFVEGRLAQVVQVRCRERRTAW